MKYLHTNIVTKNIDKLSKFYIDVFDCKVKSKGHMKGEWLDKAVNLKDAEINSIELTLPGYSEGYPYLEIFSYSDLIEGGTKSSNTTGYTHLSFEVEDVGSIYDKAILNGAFKYGELIKKEFKSGTLTFVYIKDPDGNIIEIENWTAK